MLETYFVISAIVAVVAVIIAHVRRAPFVHAWPLWLIVSCSLIVGLAWPLLLVWSMFYFCGMFGYAAWRWMAGERQDPQHGFLNACGYGLGGEHALPRARRVRLDDIGQS